MQSVKVVIESDRKQLFVNYSRELTWEGILEAEKLANRIVWENRRITATEGGREEVRKKYGERLRGRWDLIKEERLRIVEVEDFDFVACRGDHVERTGEIGFILVKKFNALGNNNYDIQFEVGEKALVHALETKKVAMSLMDVLGTTSDLAEKAARNLKDEVLALRKSLREMSKKAIEDLRYEEFKGVKIYSKVLQGLDQRELTRKAGELRKRGRTVVILGDLSGTVLVARSDDLSLSVLSLLKKSCDVFGGRCGGKEGFAYGGGLRSESVSEAVDLIKRELTAML